MTTTKTEQKISDKLSDFFARIFEIPKHEFEKYENLPNLSPEITSLELPEMSGVMALQNQPEFWADAPWRLEPDCIEIPITFYIRDANADSPGYSPWLLDTLRIEQRLENKKWHKLKTFLPEDLPDMDAQGIIKTNFWVFSISIPINSLQEIHPGAIVHLRILFTGGANADVKPTFITRHLEVLIAQHALPLGRVASAAKPRRWFYGDTHYHSAYTNDIKEYGAPIPETRAAGISIGLDWLVVTDHSCDLDQSDDGVGQTRWERLKADVISPKLSNEHFRFILGEEITLIGTGGKFVHMLAMGGMKDMIPGAFLPDDSSSLPVDIWINAIQNIIRIGKGYPPDLIQSLFGKLYSFEEVLNMLPSSTLKFAAHPYDIAQVPPSKWDDKDLAHLRLTGFEFWNGRTRRSAMQTDNPFARKGWSDPAALQSRGDARITKLQKHVSVKWEPHLIRGVEEWADTNSLPARRPVFIGGCDAHGDFNYHAGMAWDYSKVDMVDDNSLGRVRTAIFLPEHQSESVPGVDEIISALGKGSCIVTDGPVLEFHLQHKGQVAYMGDTLFVSGDGEPEMKIVAHSTPEFGQVTEVEVVTYFQGQKPKKSSSLILERGKQATIQVAGAQGYCRLQTQTVGMDGERFCCFTNPIWIRFMDPFKQTMKIDFS